MQYIDTSTIVVAAGNTVKILNIQTHQHTLLPGVSGTAIGAMAVCIYLSPFIFHSLTSYSFSLFLSFYSYETHQVHPSLRYLAVAEKGMNPCIFIYTYPFY